MNTTSDTIGGNHKTQKLLTVVIALQALTMLGLWTGQPSASTATAAIPDPGAQREAQVAEQKATNAKLDKLFDLLNSGKLKVKVDAEEKK